MKFEENLHRMIVEHELANVNDFITKIKIEQFDSEFFRFYNKQEVR